MGLGNGIFVLYAVRTSFQCQVTAPDKTSQGGVCPEPLGCLKPENLLHPLHQHKGSGIIFPGTGHGVFSKPSTGNPRAGWGLAKAGVQEPTSATPE